MDGFILIPNSTASSRSDEKDNSLFVPFYILGGEGLSLEDKIEKYKQMQREFKKDYINEELKFKELPFSRLVESGSTDEYVRKGYEINQYLRERSDKNKGRPIDMAFEEMIRRIKGKFRALEDYIGGYSDYIVVCRRTTKPYDEKYSQGFKSTSNISIKEFGEYLQVIIIPKDAEVKIINVEDQVSKKNAYEIYLKPEARLVNLKTALKDVFVVDTILYSENKKFFADVAKRIARNPLFCS